MEVQTGGANDEEDYRRVVDTPRLRETSSSPYYNYYFLDSG